VAKNQWLKNIMFDKFLDKDGQSSTPPFEISNQELKVGYWYVTNRAKIKSIVIGVLIVITVGIWIYTSWQAVIWFSGRKAEEELLNRLSTNYVNYESYRQNNAPIQLQVGSATIVPSGKDIYDVVAEIKNTNSRWAATRVPYTFTIDEKSVTGVSFLLPSENKYLVAFGIESTTEPKQASVILGETSWQRIRDLSIFPKPKLIISEEAVDSLSSLGADNMGTRLKFKLTNAGAYSFWRVMTTAILSLGGKPVAVAQQAVPNLKSGEERKVEFLWPRGSWSADKVIIFPEINVMDKSVFWLPSI